MSKAVCPDQRQLFNQQSWGHSNVPTGWKLVELGSFVTDIRNGFASGKRDEDGVVQVRMNNVTTDGRLVLGDVIKVPRPDRIERYLLREGDLLFNNTNSYDLVGKSAIFTEGPATCTFSNHFTRMRFGESVLSTWILGHFILLWQRGFFKSVAIRHVGQAAVHARDLKKIRIPLPPLPEQERIAEILSTVDRGIEKADEAIGRAKRLKRGLMRELLIRGIGHTEYQNTKIGRVPRRWDIARIDQISRVRRGASPRPIGDEKYFSERGRGWVRIADVTATSKYLTKASQYLSALGESKSVKVDPGDLIMSICATIGKPVLIAIDACIHDGFVVFRDLSADVDREYLYYVLQRNEMRFVSMKQVGTQGNLNTTLVGRTLIPLPPLPEQRRIASILGTVDARLELLRKRKERLRRIKQGLMNDLLTGRRRVRVGA